METDQKFRIVSRGTLFRTYGIIARSRPGIKQPVVTDELSKLSRRWERQYPNSYMGRGFDLSAHPLRNEMVARVWPALLVSAIAVCLLLLIAIANLITLLLARANARERELTMRLALGAPPARLWRQLVTEGLLLAFLGGVVGLLIAAIATVLSRTFFGHGIPLLGEMRLDHDIPLCIAILSLVTGLLVGGIPAWRIVGSLPRNRSPGQRPIRNRPELERAARRFGCCRNHPGIRLSCVRRFANKEFRSASSRHNRIQSRIGADNGDIAAIGQISKRPFRGRILFDSGPRLRPALISPE